jgi:cell division protein FtsB
MKKQLTAAIKENEQLKKRNETLLYQVKYLQKNQNEVESRARQDLGMIKKGETFYQITENDQPQ